MPGKSVRIHNLFDGNGASTRTHQLQCSVGIDLRTARYWSMKDEQKDKGMGSGVGMPVLSTGRSQG